MELFQLNQLGVLVKAFGSILDLPRALLLFLLFLPALSQAQSSEELCQYAGGTLQDGVCIVCLGTSESSNCCPLNPNDFSVTCEKFCTTVVHQSAQQTFCGTASCVPQGAQSTCTGSIPILDGMLNFTSSCTSADSCTCTEATWNGEVCEECSGVADGYDCTNVNGPLRKAPDNKNSSKTEEIERPYQTNNAFITAVAEKTLPEASSAAGVPIGAAVAPGGPLLEEYVPLDYNMIVAENSMKWNYLLADGETLDVYNFTDADAVVDYAISVGAAVRGHVLIWGRFKGTSYPAAVAIEMEQSDDPEKTLIDIMRRHIEAVAGHFKGRVDVWDVVNEHLSSMSDQNIFFTTLGNDYVKIAFELTREVLPGVRLVWNEAIGSFDLKHPQVVNWLELLRRYKDEGVPVDGIGIQGHSINKLHNTTELHEFLRAVVSMGYDVEVTELDAPISLFLNEDDPFQAQGDYFAGYIRACLDTGACRGITMWGLSDAITWLDFVFPSQKPNLPLLIDEEGFRKPAWLSVRRELESFEQENPNSSNAKLDTPAWLCSIAVLSLMYLAL